MLFGFYKPASGARGLQPCLTDDQLANAVISLSSNYNDAQVAQVLLRKKARKSSECQQQIITAVMAAMTFRHSAMLALLLVAMTYDDDASKSNLQPIHHSAELSILVYSSGCKDQFGTIGMALQQLSSGVVRALIKAMDKPNLEFINHRLHGLKTDFYPCYPRLLRDQILSFIFNFGTVSKAIAILISSAS